MSRPDRQDPIISKSIILAIYKDRPNYNDLKPYLISKASKKNAEIILNTLIENKNDDMLDYLFNHSISFRRCVIDNIHCIEVDIDIVEEWNKKFKSVQLTRFIKSFKRNEELTSVSNRTPSVNTNELEDIIDADTSELLTKIDGLVDIIDGKETSENYILYEQLREAYKSLLLQKNLKSREVSKRINSCELLLNSEKEEDEDEFFEVGVDLSHIVDDPKEVETSDKDNGSVKEKNYKKVNVIRASEYVHPVLRKPEKKGNSDKTKVLHRLKKKIKKK